MEYSAVGVDGCKGKWMVVYIDNQGFQIGKYKNIAEVCEKFGYAKILLIDMPIGLRESIEEVRPDAQVKKLLGKKGSSIFEVPLRQAVYAESKEESREISIELTGKSLSEQTLGIKKYIREIDEFLEKNHQWKNRLLESHPEFCFMKLNQDYPVMEKKITVEGQEKRLEILRRYYDKTDEVIQQYLKEVKGRKKLDDLIDALCLAVMGKVIQRSGRMTIPDTPMEDARGILMQMVYGE